MGDNVTGSAGLTNKWERRVAGQSLVFDGFRHIPDNWNVPKGSLPILAIRMEFLSLTGAMRRTVEIAWSDDVSGLGADLDRASNCLGH